MFGDDVAWGVEGGVFKSDIFGMVFVTKECQHWEFSFTLSDCASAPGSEPVKMGGRSVSTSLLELKVTYRDLGDLERKKAVNHKL